MDFVLLIEDLSVVYFREVVSESGLRRVFCQILARGDQP